MSFFVVAGDNANRLVRDATEQFHADLQLVHRRERFSVAIAYGALNRAVHQIAIQNREAILMVADIRNVLFDALNVAVRITNVSIRNREQLYGLELAG
jgi:hypothetical protein